MTKRSRRAILLVAIVAAAAAPAAAQASSACPAPGSYEPGGPPRSEPPVNDPLYEKQWGLDQIEVEKAWARGFSGNGVIIASVGSGVELTHPDLLPNLVEGIDALEAYVPDGCSAAADDRGWGTWFAGITSAAADNGIGIAGVAPRAALMPVRVCGQTCEWKAIFDGAKAAVDRGAKVVLLSLHTSSLERSIYYFAEIDAMVEYAWSRGAVFVAPAGEGRRVPVGPAVPEPLCAAPGGSPHGVCVAASDSRGLPTSYSNLPSGDFSSAGFRAPGGYNPGAGIYCDEAIWTTQWSGFHSLSTNAGRCGSTYDVIQGTGAAAAHVAGVAALLAEAGLSNGEIVDRLRATASNQGNTDPVMGYGIVDADAATQGLTPRPPAAGDPPTAHPAPPSVRPAQPAPAVSRACERAHGAVRLAVRRAVGASERLRRSRTPRARRRARRALSVRLHGRDRAQRRLERACAA